MLSGWEIYSLVDASVFAVIAVVCIVSLIHFVVAFPVCYSTGIILRLAILFLSFVVSLYYVISILKRDNAERAVFEIAIILLKVFLCFALYFALQQWDSLCKQAPFRPCGPSVLQVVIISAISVTGLTQMCTFLLESGTFPFVFFFANNLSTYIQMGFVLGYGCVRVFSSLKDLSEDLSGYKCPRRCLFVMCLALILMGTFGFTCFVASFCVDLGKQGMLQLFTGLCHRLPLIVALVSALIFQFLMDKIMAMAVAQNTREVELI